MTARVETNTGGSHHSRRSAIIAGALLAGTATIVASGVVRPLIYADEAGYLLNARAIAGWGATSGTKYFSGYSYLLAPVERVLASYPALSRGTQAVNIALLVLSFSLLVHLVRRTGLAAGTTAVLTGLATCAFPSYLLFTSLAMSENALLPAVLGCVIAVHAAADRGNHAWRWVLAGAACGGIVVIHPRAVVVAGAFAALSVLSLVRRSITTRTMGAGLGGLLAGTVVAGAALAATESLPWGPNQPGGSSSSTAFAQRALSWEGLGELLATAAGHLFYAAAATLGFAMIGLAWLATSAWRRRDPISTTASFVTLVVAGGVVLSAAHAAGSSGDGLIYGRYNEPFLAAPLAFGLAVTARGRRPLLNLALAVGAIGMTAALARLVLDPAALGGRVDFVNVLGVMTPIRWLGGIRLGWIAAIAIAATVTLHLFRALSGRLMLMLTGVMFLVGGVSSVDRLWHDAGERALQAELAEVVASVPDDLFGDGQPCIAFQPTSGTGWHTFNYQVLLPRYRFEILPLDDTGGSWCGDLLLSSADPGDELPGQSRLIRSENHSPYALWVRPGAVLEFLDASGALFPADWDGSVPDAAQRAQIEAPTVILDTGPVSFDVTIQHAGHGSPWPNDASSTPGSLGPVRLGVTAIGTDLDTPGYSLKRSLAPGDSTTVRVTLSADDLRRVRDGDGQIRLELVQEEVAWFGDDAATTIDVNG